MSASILDNATKRVGSASIRSNKGTPTYECQYSYTVVCTAKDEPYSSVLSATGLPSVGITPDPTGYAVCTGKSGTRWEQNPLYWDVVCDFSSEIDDSSGSGGDPSSDPTTWVPLYETKFERYQEVVTRDYSGTAVANSAGQPFPNGMTITRHIPVWEFFQIEASTVTDNQILNRIDVVNTSSFTRGGTTYAAKTLLCNVLSSVIGRYYGTLRRLTQYQIKYKADKWTHKRIDCGTGYLSGGVLKPYLIDGVVVNGALDGSGNKQSPTIPPVLREFDMYQAVSFSFLR